MFTERCVKMLEQIECCSCFPQCPFTDNAGGKAEGRSCPGVVNWQNTKPAPSVPLSFTGALEQSAVSTKPAYDHDPRNGAVIHYRLVARDSEPLQVATDTAWSRLPVSVQVTIPFFQISSNRYRGSTTRTNKHYQLRATLCSFLQYCFVSDNG